MKHSIRLFSIVLLAVVLAGCGVRSAYNNLDWLVMRWVNQQISLDAGQELMVRSALEDQLAWHCESQLPEYVAFLEGIERDVANGQLDADQLREHGEQLAAFGRDLLQQARPDILELLASLSNEQIDELRVGFEERNEELAEELAEQSPDGQQTNRVQGMERGMRRFVGRLTPEQRSRLESWAASLKPTTEENMANRTDWQARFFSALDLREDRAVFDPTMGSLLEPGTDWSDEYRATMEFNRDQTLQALADIHSMAPDRQLRRLQSRLSGWANDFERLSCS